MSFVVLNCQVVESVDIFANPVFKNPQKSQRSIYKFVKDQWNVSHDSLIHECSLSTSWFGKKSTFLGIIIRIFFACSLRHCRVMTGYHVTRKYQAKPTTIAWKVFATLKWLDCTHFCLENNIVGPQALIPLRLYQSHLRLVQYLTFFFLMIFSVQKSP